MHTIIKVFFLFFCSSSHLYSACTVTTTPVAFGAVNPLSGTPKTGFNSTITIGCAPPNLATYTLTLSQGSYGTYASRLMRRTVGIQTISYNLYTTAALTTIFGNGTSGTGVITRTNRRCTNGRPCTETAFGKLPLPQPTAIAGTYQDTITATLTYN